MGKIVDSILESSGPEGLLYHYTTQPGLLGMVQKKKIWATNILYLNDGAELRYTLDLAEKAAWSITRRIEGILQQFIYDKVVSWINQSHRDIYVASFSIENNDLSQWRAYGKGGGFCLGFDFEALVEAMRTQRFVLAPCIYDEETQHKAIDELIAELVELFVGGTTIPEHGDPIFDPRNRMSEMNVLVSRLIGLSARFKDSSFKAEQEWRLITTGFVPQERLLFREGKHCVIPYVEFQLPDKGALREIVIGPCEYPQLASQSVKALFTVHNAPSHWISKIPFRSSW